jgi:anaerobic ribonucleoside-triphosphate reductase activating protein
MINLLKNVDVLVDGKYLQDKRVEDLNEKQKEKYPLRGSTNQRLIDVIKTLKSKKVILYKI